MTKVLPEILNQFPNKYAIECLIHCSDYYLFNISVNEKLTQINIQNFLSVSACNFTKSTTPPLMFSRFLNCKIIIKSRKTSHMFKVLNGVPRNIAV